MRRFLFLAALLAGLACIVVTLFYLSEARRLGAANRLLRDKLAQQEQRVADLERDLGAALRERGEVVELLETKAEERRRLEAEREARSRSAFAPIPAGVRLILATLNDCLRGDGHDGLRFVRAEKLVDRQLHSVELLERAPDGLGSSLYFIDRLSVSLDRAENSLTFVCSGGHRYVDGVRETIAETGLPLTLASVHGPTWERSLPALVEAVGEYEPVTEDVEVDMTARLDRYSHEVWSTRLNNILQRADADYDYRLDRLVGLERGAFLQVLLLGYGSNKLLARAIEAERMTVVTDHRARTVELVLHDGTLRGKAGDTKIPPEGYRVLLVGVTPEQVERELFGMVEQR